VSQRAVHDDAGVSYVYVLRDDKLERTPVKVGPRSEGEAFVEVREGLSAGDRVIVADIGDDKAGAVARVRQIETSAAGKTEIVRN